MTFQLMRLDDVTVVRSNCQALDILSGVEGGGAQMTLQQGLLRALYYISDKIQ